MESAFDINIVANMRRDILKTTESADNCSVHAIVE